jgi:hypothetical protein
MIGSRPRPHTVAVQLTMCWLMMFEATHHDYVHWAHAMQFRWPTVDNALKQAAWTFLPIQSK